MPASRESGASYSRREICLRRVRVGKLVWAMRYLKEPRVTYFQPTNRIHIGFMKLLIVKVFTR